MPAWHPGTSPKQDKLREMCRQKKFVLAQGPRFSTKTLGALNCFVEHSWLTPRGNNCIITLSQSVGLDSGVWKDMCDVIIPQWIAGDFGMRWVRKSYTIGTTKRPTCEITNASALDMDVELGEDDDPLEEISDAAASALRSRGGTTVIQLESLKVESEVEDRFKPKRYSGIYVPELSTFRNRKTFDTWTECLRMLGLPSDKHLFLADTNASDEGNQSWIYKIWFELLDAEESEVNPKELGLRAMLGRVDFDIGDNTFDTVERIEELKSKYYHDPDLYARYIEGRWVTASEDALFYTVYRPLVHEVGEPESKKTPDPDIMVPEEGCYQLLSGWDLGVTNSAFTVAEQVWRVRGGEENGRLLTAVPDFKLRKSSNEQDQRETKFEAVLKFLDELVITGEVFNMDDFAVECLTKMLFWEDIMDRRDRVIWRNWSDRSAFDFVEPVTSRYHHQIVYDATAGRIMLQAAPKGPGSVLQRVDMWKKFLFDERLYFSRARCPKLIIMNKSIKRGSSSLSVISKGSVHKHIFDAASYISASEFPEELQRNIVDRLLAQRKKSENRVITVPV